MGIKVKAVERRMAFNKEKDDWRYVISVDNNGSLSESKVIAEAALRSGLPKGTVRTAWSAIGEVISAWVTEGHSVMIPQVGTLRFGVRGKAVADVENVKTDLIESRRVVFTPSQQIRQELASTPIAITCYDREGRVVKRVNSGDAGDSSDSDTPVTPGGGSSDGDGGLSDGDE